VAVADWTASQAGMLQALGFLEWLSFALANSGSYAFRIDPQTGKIENYD
jgi:hypothetical protein